MRRVGESSDTHLLIHSEDNDAAAPHEDGGAPLISPHQGRQPSPSSQRVRSARAMRLVFFIVVAMALVSVATYMAEMKELSAGGSNSVRDELVMVQVIAPTTPHAVGSVATKQFAYVLYVTNDIYGCAALHLLDRMVHGVQMNTSRIELVVLYSPEVSQEMQAQIQTAVHPRMIAVETIQADAQDATWQASLTKLHAFQEWGYDRVVYIDADSVPLQNLDHLFDLPLSAPLFAPRAYWLPQPFFASTLMVIEPSNETFQAILQWARAQGPAAGFDMDILNAYFQDTVQYLPGDYTVLNSDFRKRPSEETKLYSTVTELKSHAKLVHFSCKPNGEYGKPWAAQQSDLDAQEGQNFDPLFAQLYRDFWQTQREWCEWRV